MTSILEDIQHKINLCSFPVGELSDGYHSFNDLYNHRIQLWIQYLKLQTDYLKLVFSNGLGNTTNENDYPWRTKIHSDDTEGEGWFLLGIGKDKGEQITYHLPIEKWDECDFAKTLSKAPEFDGHTSKDVLERLKKL